MIMRFSYTTAASTYSYYSLVVLILLCQHLSSFVQCQVVQPRLNSTEMGVLKALHDSTGGNLGGGWTYDCMAEYINDYDSLYVQTGRNWTFTKNATGAFLEDPCPNAATSTMPFMGVNCTCSSTSCSISALAVPCGNLVGEIPSQIFQLTHLTFLDMSSNQLTGPISSKIGQLTLLTYLILYNNILTGSIPSELGNLVHLQDLILHNNKLTGLIPSELGNLVQLQDLNLDTNMLTSSIPSELGNLVQLQYLWLYNNILTGSIPSELGNLVQLQYLDLDTNMLTGSIPSELGNLVQLRYLQFQNNRLIGSIPSELGNLVNMLLLNLANNTLSGPVPPELSNLKSLKVLLLQNNSFVSSSNSNNAFSFIDPQTLTNLTILDISNNEFTGTIAKSIFALPNLNVFAAGSNCFSGSLPSNICNATNLNTLAISGLSNADSCRKYYWKGTIFADIFGFNGFHADHLMEGSIPQCIYSMPNMETLHVSGNFLLGKAPFSGEDNSGFNTSPVMNDLNVARNRLVGTISSQLITATTGVGNIRKLDMSYNRIAGNLSAFSCILDAYVNANDTSPFILALEVNHLSGDIPKPLLPLKNINLLTGNLFDCTYSKKDLPQNDPALESYQCGSTNLNNMLIAFAAVVAAGFIIILIMKLKRRLQKYVRVMRLWLDVADGRRNIDKDFEITHMKRYFNYFRDLRYFVLVIGLLMILVFIVYVSLSGRDTRTLEHSYAWVTTAAYLSGETSTVIILVTCTCIIILTWYLVMENKWDAVVSGVSDQGDNIILPMRTTSSNNININRNAEEDNSSYWLCLRIRLMPLLRVIILIVLIWGVLIGGNVFYLRILLHGTTEKQESFKVFFAAFKLIWTMAVTTFLFESKWLYLGVQEDHHNAFINYWLGGKVKMMFAFNAISSFWIPLLTILVVRHECFYNAFIGAHPVPVTFEYRSCAMFNYDGTCWLPHKSSVYSTLDVPFVYNYTCSPAILRAYVPLYQLMFMFLIIRSALQLGYLCFAIEKAESVIEDQSKNDECNAFVSSVKRCGDCIKSLLAAGILKSMPTKHLMYDSRQRQESSHKMGDMRVFSTQPKVWITKAIPMQLGGVALLLTFAVLAPLLAMSIILFFLLDSYISQLVLGRFLVTELGVVMEYKRCHDPTFYNGMNRPETVYVSPNKLARIQNDIEDATKPWGAFAVLKEVNDQCRQMPASTISIGRTAFVIAPSITMAFTINDVLNASRDEPQYWPSMLLICLAVTLEVLTIVNNCYTTTASEQMNNNENSMQEFSEQKAEMKHCCAMIYEDNPIHNEHLEQSAVDLAPQKVYHPHGIDADRDSSIQNCGIELGLAVSISVDEKEQQKKEDAISPMHDVTANDHDIEAAQKTSVETREEKGRV